MTVRASAARRPVTTVAARMRLIVSFRRSDGSDASRPVDEEPDGEIVPVFEPVHNQES